MYPKAYIQFLVHFHGNFDYFECHEILEEHWKVKPAKEREKHWVGFIQVAVSLYHHRRENWAGAERMMKSALTILQTKQEEVASLGLHPTKLITLLQKQLYATKQRQSFIPVFLPFTDAKLEEACIQLCAKQNIPWKDESYSAHEYIIDKHMLRDRSDVIKERSEQLQKRKQRNDT
ncbi:hypothetical protein BAMA_09660 [Bacillus manliponensis]|uniref:DUF309 domain-containing protein n=1 Tax=Bacillus manliponensis TaxID=574376 RepID=A0A073K3L9_9BACI|nr:DUF309 domain-containing protein [Bacillus manliponensis]KEK21047.1 hypothetical protein BAMA_09660 [Bacillus manliponensis]